MDLLAKMCKLSLFIVTWSLKLLSFKFSVLALVIEFPTADADGGHNQGLLERSGTLSAQL